MERRCSTNEEKAANVPQYANVMKRKYIHNIPGVCISPLTVYSFGISHFVRESVIFYSRVFHCVFQHGRRRSRDSSGGRQTQLRSPMVQRPSASKVTLQGWLFKQGSEGLMLWKRRWFVLSEYCLFYYKGEFVSVCVRLTSEKERSLIKTARCLLALDAAPESARRVLFHVQLYYILYYVMLQ